MTFTIFQVIAYLNKLSNKNRKFRRVGDEKFKLFRGIYGDLMIELNDTVRVCPIFNYMQDEWILEDVQE